MSKERAPPGAARPWPHRVVDRGALPSWPSEGSSTKSSGDVALGAQGVRAPLVEFRAKRPRTPVSIAGDLDALSRATTAPLPDWRTDCQQEEKDVHLLPMVGSTSTTSTELPSTSFRLQPSIGGTAECWTSWASSSSWGAGAHGDSTWALSGGSGYGCAGELPQVVTSGTSEVSPERRSSAGLPELRTRQPKEPPSDVGADLMQLSCATSALPGLPVRVEAAPRCAPATARGPPRPVLDPVARAPRRAEAERGAPRGAPRDDTAPSGAGAAVGDTEGRGGAATARAPRRSVARQRESHRWARRQSRRLTRSTVQQNEKSSASDGKDGAANGAADSRKGGGHRGAHTHNYSSNDGGLPLEQEQALVPDKTVPVGRLHELSRESRVPFDLIMAAFEIFAELAVPMSGCSRSAGSGAPAPSGSGAGVAPLRRTVVNGARTFDVLAEGELTTDSFAKVLCKLSNVDAVESLPNGLLSSSFYGADSDNTNNLDFLEFASWYSRHGFSESVLLTAEQKRIRQIARKHGLPIVEVEEYKKAFDHFDEDGSGEIEYEEFVDLLNTLINVPKHLELPSSRVRQFWTETVSDKGGAVGFEDFLLFYTRYFSKTGPGKRDSKTSPLEEFYHAIRPVPVQRAW